MKRSARIATVWVGVNLAVVALLLMGQHSRTKKALGRLKASLRAKGEKLTLRELMLTRDTNVYFTHTLLSNAVAGLRSPQSLPNELWSDQFTGPGQSQVVWRQDTFVTGSGPTNWDQLAAAIDVSQAALQQMREALKDPAPDAGPWTTISIGRRVDFVTLRTVSRWLVASALTEVRRGRLDQAIETLEAEAALARLDREDYMLLAQMVRITIGRMGLAATWQALQAKGWNEPQLARLQHAWEEVHLLDSFEKGMLGERAVGEEVIAIARNTNNPTFWSAFGLSSTSVSPDWLTQGRDHLLFMAYRLTSADEDELLFRQTTEKFLDAARSLSGGAPLLQVKWIVDQTVTNFTQVFSSWTGIRYRICAVAIPNLSRAFEGAGCVETERQLTLAAIALERYRLRHGQLPASLRDLVPEFLTSLPNDPMTAQPLNYRLEAEGRFILYSVGLDGKDDGGDPTPIVPGKFGLWEARDAVWPAAADKQ